MSEEPILLIHLDRLFQMLQGCIRIAHGEFSGSHGVVDMVLVLLGRLQGSRVVSQGPFVLPGIVPKDALIKNLLG